MPAQVRFLLIAVSIAAVTACSNVAKAPDPATDDLAYLTELGLMRGHLLVGKSLYDQGFSAAAKTHMKHPKSELYAGLEPQFRARGNVGFALELEMLASAVEQDKSRPEVDAAYQQLLDAINVAERAAPTYPSVHMQFQRVAALLRNADDEYREGIVDGVPVMPHEYQDAYGFTEVAKQVLASIDAESGSKSGVAISYAIEQLNTLHAAWPALVPPAQVSFDSAAISRVAQEVERLANTL